MIKQEIKLQEVVDFLNEMLEVDADVINSLFAIRVPCNKKLAQHKTVQVMAFGKDIPGKERQFYLVGLIGLLNGLVGSFDDGERKGWGCLSMDVEGHKIKKFSIIENNAQ